MRRLLLLRHAKSDWSRPGQPDRDRVLSERGRLAAPLMGAYMKSHGLMPDLALVSPATRTRETWNLVAAALQNPPPARFEAAIYEQGPEALLELIQTAPDSAKTIVVVGHNPTFHAVALDLVGAGDIEARRKLTEKFPTAALAVIDFVARDWRGVHRSGGRLERFVSPRSLQDAPD
jgi:phosphohistidine phosphatase